MGHFLVGSAPERTRDRRKKKIFSNGKNRKKFFSARMDVLERTFCIECLPNNPTWSSVARRKAPRGAGAGLVKKKFSKIFWEKKFRKISNERTLASALPAGWGRALRARDACDARQITPRGAGSSAIKKDGPWLDVPVRTNL